MRAVSGGRHRVAGLVSLVACVAAASCASRTAGTGSSGSGRQGSTSIATTVTIADERPIAAQIVGRIDGYLAQWSSSAATNPMLLIDVAMNAGFVQRNYPDVASMEWLAAATAAAADKAASAGLPAAYVDRLLVRSSPHSAAVALPKIESATDAAVYASLWCDDPSTVAAVDAAAPRFTLGEMIKRGGYDATHAIGAAQLSEELGCAAQAGTGGPRPTPSEAWAVLRPLIVDRAVDDLMLEACGIASYRGLREAMPAIRSRLGDIERAQRSDGAFGRTVGREADPHATVWALRCLAPLASTLVVPEPTWIVR